MIDFGIKIDTEKGIKDAENEIKKWIDKLQIDLNSRKFKVDFDVSDNAEKYFKSISKSSKSLNEAKGTVSGLKEELMELEKLWGLLTASERTGDWGKELMDAWRELSAQADGLDSSLRQAVKSIDASSKEADEMAKSAEKLSTKLKELETQWSSLNAEERKGSKGQDLRDKYSQIISSTNGYSSSLKSAVAHEQKMTDAIRRSIDEQERKNAKLREAAEYLSTYKGKVESLEKQWAKLNAEQRRGEKGQSIVKEMKDLDEAYGKYKGTVRQVISEEKEHEMQMQKTSRTMSQLKNMAMTYLSVYTGIRVAKEMANITGEFEQQKKALGAMLQNAERAEIIFKQIKSLAIVSPFEVRDLVNYSKQLIAFSVPYEELYDTTKRLADISSGLGVDMGRIILAYGQVRSAAVLRGQELRQFTEAGIPLIDELVRKFKELGETGITTADIFDKIYQRQVPFEMIKDIFTDMTSEGGKFFKMQEVQTDTLKGKITNLTDAYDIMLSEIGEKGQGIMGGFVDTLKSLLINHESLIPALTATAVSMGVVKIASIALNDSFRKLITTQLVKNLAIGATTAWGALAIAIGGLAYIMSKHIREAGALKKAYDEVNQSMSKFKDRVATEEALLDLAVKRLRRATVGTDEYNAAKENIVRKWGSYLTNLKLEVEQVRESEKSYRQLADAIKESANARAMGDFMESAGATYAKEIGETWLDIKKSIMASAKPDGKTYGEKEADEVINTLKGFVSNASDLTEEGRREVGELIRSFDFDKLVWGDDIKRTYNDVKAGLDMITKANEDLDKLENEAKTMFSGYEHKSVPTGTVEVHKSINQLLKERAKVEAEINKINADRNKQFKGEDLERISGLKEQLKKINEDLEARAYVEPKISNKTSNNIKDELKAIKELIDDYSRQIDINKVLGELEGTPLVDFIKKQIGILGAEKPMENYLQKSFDDIIGTATIDAEKKSFMKDLYNQVVDMEIKSYKDMQAEADELQKRLDDTARKYESFAEKIKRASEEADDEILALMDSGADDEAVRRAEEARLESIENIKNQFAKESSDYQVFLADIAKMNMGQMSDMVRIVESSLDEIKAKFGENNEEYIILVEMLSTLKEKLQPDEKNFEKWRKLQTQLSRTSAKFREITDDIGGLTGEALMFAEGLTTSTISIIEGIEMVSKGSMGAIEGTAIGATTAIKSVERASVILEVIAAALKVIQAVVNFTKKLVNSKYDREIKKQKKTLEELQKQYKILQHEIKKAFGSDYFKQANVQLENLRKQQAALSKQLESENKKSGSKSKKNAKELEDALVDNKIAQEDLISDMVERMAGTSLSSAARSFADAWAEAYYSFEDTSKAIEERFKEMARNMVIENVIAGRIGKILEPSFKHIEDSLEDGVISEKEMKTWLGMMENANKVMQDESAYWEQIMESLGDLLGRGKGESNLTGISKGIANASEDTVLLVGGYLDSIRFKLFPYIDFMMGEYSSTINIIMTAQIQQVNHLREIEANTKDTSVSNRDIAEALNSVIEVGSNGKKLRI